MKSGITLIADAGGTKTEWACTGVPEVGVRIVRSLGVNAVVASEQQLAEALEEAAFRIGLQPDRIFYYGAGCGSESTCRRVSDALKQAFNCRDIEVASDLQGVARALFGRGRGIAGILGTGSATGYCVDGNVVERVPSLGYILGDEGSGAALGKRLLSDYLKGTMPDSLRMKFAGVGAPSADEVIERVYRSSAPNAYLASFVPLISEWRQDEYIARMLREEFERFIDRNVLPYRLYAPVGLCGGVAAAFAREITEALRTAGFDEEITIVKSPLEGLISYYDKEN